MESIFDCEDILYEILRHSDYNVVWKLYLLLRPRKLIYKALTEIESNHEKILKLSDKKYKNEFIKELVNHKELIFGIEISKCILDTLNNKEYYYRDNKWNTIKWRSEEILPIGIDIFEKDPKHLICFKNGVYDLKLSKFRKTNKFDYCTLTTCDNYPDNKSNTSELRNYKLKLFPVKDDYIHFMKILYLIFLGKQYYINTIGTNCNGFSILLNIIHYMFFDYSKYVPIYKFHSFLEEYKQSNYKLLILDDDTSIENIENLTAHCSIIQRNYSNLSNLTTIIPQTKPLHFRSTFVSENENPEQYIYLKDDMKIDVHSEELMSQLIQIHESVDKILNFKYNDLNQDVNNIIIDYFVNVIFDV